MVFSVFVKHLTSLNTGFVPCSVLPVRSETIPCIFSGPQTWCRSRYCVVGFKVEAML